MTTMTDLEKVQTPEDRELAAAAVRALAS